MAGLYLHVPFCRQKCTYCDFYSLTPSTIDEMEYLDLLEREAALRAPGSGTLESVFFGGGTPSLLHPETVSAALAMVSRYFHLSPTAEISLEANPGTVDATTLVALRQAGVNRLSFGIQTLNPRLLWLLGRQHSPEQALQAIAAAQQAGFDNISADLIYGIPGQTLDDWQESLRLLAAAGLQHLSLYALEVHPATPLGEQVAAGELALPADDLVADMYEAAQRQLPVYGLEQYEISNFARAGFECRHNLNYWYNGDYVGLGPAACSYLQGERACNVSDYGAWRQRLQAGQLATGSSERLDLAASKAETIILGLRLTQGVDAAAYQRRFGSSLEDDFGPTLTDLLDRRWLIRTQRGYAIPQSMLLVANRVFLSFLDGPNT
ncbi:MAG: radical SAM family heme chaperone HemW [Bacillota bacterium]|jgi:oxygen-independent coproporphyrinogen-3 oxidase